MMRRFLSVALMGCALWLVTGCGSKNTATVPKTASKQVPKAPKEDGGTATQQIQVPDDLKQ
jgi:hypothetical protein